MANVGATVATYMLLNRGLKRFMGVGKVLHVIRLGVWGLREIAHGVLLLQIPYKTHLEAPPLGPCVADFKFDRSEGTAPSKKQWCKHHRAGSIRHGVNPNATNRTILNARYLTKEMLEGVTSTLV
jgi:hypothetical protein